jgi:hypothetical protein
MPDGFEEQPVGIQHEMRLQSTTKETELTGYLNLLRQQVFG